MNVLVMTALGAAAAITVSGCAAMNKTRPGDMTVPEHDAAAREEAKRSEEAEGRAAAAGRTVAYRQEASRHRQLAKDHAAAAEQRRNQVASACDAVAAPAPLATLKVERTQPISESSTPRALQNGRGYYPERLVGARVSVVTSAADAGPVARSITCEAARDSAGLTNPMNPASPFAIRTATATATPASSGVVVEIRSPDEGDAAEILRRAQALAPRCSSSP